MKKLNIILGIILITSFTLATPIYNVSTTPTELYATSKHADIISFKHEFSNCDCPTDYRYVFFLDLPQWYDGATIRDFNAFTSDPSSHFTPVDCFYNAIDNQIVCDTYSGGGNILDIDSFSLSYTIATNYSEGNPIRNETWTPTLKCLKGSDVQENTLSDNIIFSAPELTIAEPSENIVNKIFTTTVYEIPNKGIPFFVKFKLEHPSQTIPEQPDSERIDGWSTVFDTTHYDNAEVLLNVYACDHKLKCGDPIQKLITITDANLTEVVDENVTNESPQIVSAKIDDLDGVLIEGQIAIFTAEVTDPENDDLNYTWNFGDGTTSNQENPSHAYTLAEGRKRQTFNVNLSITDGVNSKEHSFSITVEKATILIEFISPAKDSFRKNEEVPIRISVTDSDFIPIDGTVTAYIGHADKKQYLELSKVETGIFEGEFNPTPKTYENSYLRVNFDYNMGGQIVSASREKALNFKSQDIDVKISGKEFVKGETIGEIEISFSYLDGTDLSSDDIELDDLQVKYGDNKYEVQVKDKKFLANIDEEYQEGVTLILDGLDVYGNIVEKEAKLEFTEVTPKIDVVEEEPEEIIPIREIEKEEKSTETNILPIIILIILAVIGGGLYYFRDKIKIPIKLETPKMPISGNRKKELLDLMKKIKLDYYDKKITMDEYKNKLEDYQKELKQIEELEEEKEKMQKERMEKRQERRKKIEDDKVISVIEEEYEGPKELEKEEKESFLSKIFSGLKGGVNVEEELNNPPVDVPETAEKEIRRLIRVLGAKKSHYSREEIAKALYGEGYSEKIVLGVLDRLYKK